MPDAELDPTDPFAREAQMFPHLSQEMAERIAAYGSQETLAPGTVVFERGQRGVDFFFVLQGAIEICDTDAHGVCSAVTTHRERQFTGELDLFNDREILVSGRSAGDSRVIRVRRADFRRMVGTEADIGEILLRAFILRRVGFIRHLRGGVVVVGVGHAARTVAVVTFLTRNAYPHRLLDTEVDPDAAGFLDCFTIDSRQLPVVVLPGERLLRRPDIATLAEALGLTESIDPGLVFDVVVVGAGPAGLAAAVYAASEGLSTLVLEKIAPGGQAGTSSKIENYLGFPTGISGQALAGRAQVQAQKFGAKLAIAREVAAIDCSAAPFSLQLAGGSAVQARAVVVATGARYRKLDVPDYERFEGQGIHYAATGTEAALCGGGEVVVVGGGNSAGQAAMFLSRHVAHVHILVRSAGLAATMSDYLVQRIAASHIITLHPHTEIVALAGDDMLREVTWETSEGGHGSAAVRQTRKVTSVFVMIGASPNSDWLRGCLELDRQGFVLTGTAVRPSDPGGAAPASSFATSQPGIWAVGDVRAGSVKRVASGVGEGSVVVQSVHAFLHPVEA